MGEKFDPNAHAPILLAYTYIVLLPLPLFSIATTNIPPLPPSRTCRPEPTFPVVALPFPEPRPEPGLVRAVPPERRQVLQFPEEADVQQPVVPEPRQPVAVQQFGERRQRIVALRLCRRPAPPRRAAAAAATAATVAQQAAAGRTSAATDHHQFLRVASGVHFRSVVGGGGGGGGHHAGLQQTPTVAVRSHAAPTVVPAAAAVRRNAREKQKQILPNSVINVSGLSLPHPLSRTCTVRVIFPTPFLPADPMNSSATLRNVLLCVRNFNF